MARYDEQRGGEACTACAGGGVVERPDGFAVQCSCRERRRPQPPALRLVTADEAGSDPLDPDVWRVLRGERAEGRP